MLPAREVDGGRASKQDGPRRQDDRAGEWRRHMGRSAQQHAEAAGDHKRPADLLRPKSYSAASRPQIMPSQTVKYGRKPKNDHRRPKYKPHDAAALPVIPKL